MDTYLNLARNCTCWQRPLMQVLVIVAAMGISLCHCYAASPYTPDAGNDDRQLEKSPNLLTKPTLSDCIGYYKWADKKLRLYTEEEIREATAGDPVIQSIKEECIGSQGEKADYFHGIDFVNNLEGWAAGWNGKILHTADGGASWREQASGTRKHLMSVDFVDAQHGWAVGHEGVVLHTSNGGKTWMTQAVLGNIILEKISCPTRLNCWIGSHYQGFVFATSDGGIKWQRQATKHKGAVKSIFFSDQMKGWAVTGIGEVVKTNDGGKSWMLKTVSKPAQLTGIHFSSPSLGWITGMDGSLYQSRDGGETWEDASDGLRPLAGNVGMGYLDLMNVHFVDSLVGWLVGLNGIIVATRDGGKNWFVQQDEVNAVSSLYGVSFVGKSRGWASGNMGHIYATVDGGGHWGVVHGIGLSIGRRMIQLLMQNDQELFTKGATEYRKQRFQKAREKWQKAARHGHPLAAYKLSKMQTEGIGGAVDHVSAAQLIKQAAEGNIVDAQLQLAENYGSGTGFTRSVRDQMTWYLIVMQNAAATAEQKEKATEALARLKAEFDGSGFQALWDNAEAGVEVWRQQFRVRQMPFYQ